MRSDYSADQWKQARTLFESTKLSVQRIADRTGIKPDAIESVARRKAWLRPKLITEAEIVKKTQEKIEHKIQSIALRKAEGLAEQASEFRQKAIGASFRLVGVLNSLCDKLESSDLDPSTLADCVQKAASTHSQLTGAAWKQFGLDSEKPTQRIGLFLPVQLVAAPHANGSLATGALGNQSAALLAGDRVVDVAGEVVQAPGEIGSDLATPGDTTDATGEGAGRRDET